jgi:hypothetical protein
VGITDSVVARLLSAVAALRLSSAKSAYRPRTDVGFADRAASPGPEDGVLSPLVWVLMGPNVRSVRDDVPVFR